MKTRIFTGIAIIAGIILALCTRELSLFIFDVIIGLLAVAAAFEMSKLLSKAGRYNNSYIVGIFPTLCYVITILSIFKDLPLYFILLAILACLLIVFGVYFIVLLLMKKQVDDEIAIRKLKVGREKFALVKSVNTIIGCIYPTLLFMLFILLNHLTDMTVLFPAVSDFAYVGLIALVFAFALPIITDTFAMLTGMLIGGKKLCEKISPKKTISGAVGGLVWAIGFSIAIFFIFNSIPSLNSQFVELNWQFWHFALLGLFASIAGQCGDLFESFLKRKAGEKDSGTLFPGHGGVLDRFDSHLFSVIVVFIFFIIML